MFWLAKPGNFSWNRTLLLLKHAFYSSHSLQLQNALLIGKLFFCSCKKQGNWLVSKWTVLSFTHFRELSANRTWNSSACFKTTSSIFSIICSLVFSSCWDLCMNWLRLPISILPALLEMFSHFNIKKKTVQVGRGLNENICRWDWKTVSVEQVMKEYETTKDFKRELVVKMCIWKLIV